MSFDFRVVYYESDNDKTEYITEVYYDDNGNIEGWIAPENMNILAEEIDFYAKALSKPKLMIGIDGRLVELNA